MNSNVNFTKQMKNEFGFLASHSKVSLISLPLLLIKYSYTRRYENFTPKRTVCRSQCQPHEYNKHIINPYAATSSRAVQKVKKSPPSCRSNKRNTFSVIQQSLLSFSPSHTRFTARRSSLAHCYSHTGRQLGHNCGLVHFYCRYNPTRLSVYWTVRF
jgi:hypothetical protein